MWQQHKEILELARLNPGQPYGDGKDVIAIFDEEYDLLHCPHYRHEGDVGPDEVQIRYGFAAKRSDYEAAQSLLVS